MTALLPSDLEEKEIDKAVKQITSYLEKGGAKIKTKKDPEKRNLAYEVGHKSQAFYVFFGFSLEPVKLAEIERSVKMDGGIMRYLIINKGE